MDLKCHEQMPDEKTMDLSRKTIIKTLYKLARKKLFKKEYFCMYCGMLDFDKEWMQIHIKNFHDEFIKIVTMFQCKICGETVMKNDIITHNIQKHV